MEMMIYRHYGTDHFDPSMVLGPKAKQPGLSIKPCASFWASPVNSERSWEDWCKCNGFWTGDESRVDFELSPEAKIYRISSVEDWENLKDRFPGRLRSELELRFADDSSHYADPDWIAVAEVFDGIEVSISSCPALYDAMYGYDVDSIAVWNPDVVVMQP